MAAVVAPVDIAHSRSRNELAITWEDGSTSVFAVAYLRGWCPCAGCQGHGNVVTFREIDPSVSAEAIFEVGAYAIGIRFSDGHDAGIYPWSWLRSISAESRPQGLKRGRFVAGQYEPPTP